VGTPSELVDTLGAEAELGVEGFVFQFSDFGTPETLHHFMRTVAPALRGAAG
jgi:alkanesulfonate monooxygenase SsuD/methylene tetrahydromethanopterin reductase-like flavin-dependent oxidoreductase (luciferase family)